MSWLHLLTRAGSVGRMVVGELCGRKQTPDLWSPPPWVALQTLNVTHVASPGHTPHPLPPVGSDMSTAPPQKPKPGASADPQCSVQLNTSLSCFPDVCPCWVVGPSSVCSVKGLVG